MSGIWIKLYIGQSDPDPRVFDIDGSPRNISRMKTKIKEAGQNYLAHCDAHRLDVYPQGTSVPISKDVQPIDPRDPVPRGSDPLIVIAPVNQQQQQDGQRPNEIALDAIAAERIAKLADFAQSEMDNRTENKPMSEASIEWAESILASYRVQHKTSTTVNTDAGSSDDPPRYEWTIQTNSGEVWSKTEHRGTPGALEWLKEHFLDTNGAYELKVVTGASLPKVKGNRRSATGKADIAIGTKSDINYGDTYTFVRGLIELKTDKSPLKTGQNLLELLALSTASSFERAVVLLATNCNDNWEVYHFASGTEVRRQIYKHGRKAWEDFIRLVDSVGDRNYPDQFWCATLLSLPSISDQDLEGFPETDRDRKKAKAEKEEAMLERFADQLENIYGERPVVPSWARAHQRIPDYYD